MEHEWNFRMRKNLIPAKEYEYIKQAIPILRVDVVVRCEGEILLLKRVNEPAKGQYWTPGGRVLIGEALQSAAIRKVVEETGIMKYKTISNSKGIVEAAFDIGYMYHTPTVVFRMELDEKPPMILTDNQSAGYKWVAADDGLHEILQKIIAISGGFRG